MSKTTSLGGHRGKPPSNRVPEIRVAARKTSPKEGSNPASILLPVLWASAKTTRPTRRSEIGKSAARIYKGRTGLPQPVNHPAMCNSQFRRHPHSAKYYYSKIQPIRRHQVAIRQCRRSELVAILIWFPNIETIHIEFCSFSLFFNNNYPFLTS